jgi:drug/metabolite transporter (DMT)-like permease
LDAWNARPQLVDVRIPLPLAVVILCGCVYHLAQRSAGAARPWTLLAVAYGVAFAVTIVPALAGPRAAWAPSPSEWIAGAAIGIAAVGIEAGFFFLYRSGWPLASASVIGNASVTAILAVVGMVALGEQLTAARAVGLVLALAGAALIARG